MLKDTILLQISLEEIASWQAAAAAAASDCSTGRCLQVLSLMEEQPHPTHFAVIFDARGKNFRCPQSHVSRLLWAQR